MAIAVAKLAAKYLDQRTAAPTVLKHFNYYNKNFHWMWTATSTENLLRWRDCPPRMQGPNLMHAMVGTKLIFVQLAFESTARIVGSNAVTSTTIFA